MLDTVKRINQGEDALLASMSSQQIADLVSFMDETGASMRLDKFQRLMASVSPDLVTNTLTQNITANLLEAYYNWADDWKLFATVGRSEYMDTQIMERVDQLGMVSKLEDSGEDFNEMNIGDASEISYGIKGYGDMVSVDLRTRKSDRLDYFDGIGDRLGRACGSRLHNTIFVDYLQSNPTVDDSNSLFDETNHANDMDDSAAGVALTYDNLVAGFRLQDAMVDGSGEPIGSDTSYLVVGRYWREIADQIVENPNKPTTMNNDINTIRKRVRKVIYSRKLTYDWYLLGDPKELPGLHINFFEGIEEPRVDPEKADGKFQFEHPGRQRWRLYHFYGLVWKYWQAAIRGSTNNL